jgi:hypothetical protein
MKTVIILGLLVASYSTLVRADDKDATDVAYCIGVHQHDIEEWKAGIGKGSALAKTKLKDLELQKYRREAFLEHAVKQKAIDYITASKMTSVGYADAKQCGIGTEQCMNEFVERDAKKVDNETNNKILGNCNKETEPFCERAYKNCD